MRISLRLVLWVTGVSEETFKALGPFALMHEDREDMLLQREATCERIHYLTTLSRPGMLDAVKFLDAQSPNLRSCTCPSLRDSP